MTATGKAPAALEERPGLSWLTDAVPERAPYSGRMLSGSQQCRVIYCEWARARGLNDGFTELEIIGDVGRRCCGHDRNCRVHSLVGLSRQSGFKPISKRSPNRKPQPDWMAGAKYVPASRRGITGHGILAAAIQAECSAGVNVAQRPPGRRVQRRSKVVDAATSSRKIG